MLPLLKSWHLWEAVLAAITFAASVFASASSHGGIRQRVSVDQLPEDGNLPYLMVFTHDEPTERDQWALDCVSVAAEGHDVRYIHLTPKHPRFADYAPHHCNDLPCILTLDAEATQVLSVLRGSHMPSDPITMVNLIKIDENESATELKGRLFAPSQPPYWLRPWKWGRRPCPQPAPSPGPSPSPLPPVNVNVPPAPDAALQARLLELEAAKLEDQVQPSEGNNTLALILTGLAGLFGGAGGAGIQWKKSLTS